MIYKKHIQKMRRYQTSVGRDLDNGIRLDRNEKVSDFSPEVLNDIFSKFKGYSLSASPDAISLYDKISKYLKFKREQIFITSGITEGIRILYDFCTNPGDNIICLDPTFPMYWIYADMYQLEYRKFTYDTTSLLPNIDTLYNQMDDKTRFVIIPNPNLPIESCFNVDQIREIATECKKRNITLVIDEAYHYWGGPSVLNMINEFDNMIVFRTFSKIYGLAGLRLGFMVSNQKIIDYVSKSRSIVESNTMSMSIAEYMLDHPELRDQHILEVKEGAKFIQEEFTKLGYKWYGGNYTNGILIFLDSKEQSDKVVEHFKQKKIYIRGSFESPFESTIRISIGEKIKMRKFIEEFKTCMNH